MFPTIRHLDDLLPHIKNKPSINAKLQPNGTTVVCYSISTPDLFDTPHARECRGITFDRDGNILARALHKFFNVGEKEHTQVNVINWNGTERVMDKRDGSMITAMILDGQVVCKTKKSFETIQALNANELMKANPKYEAFVRECAKLCLTPTFEWTSPVDRIVLKYDSPELVLLHLRDLVTGRYILNIESIAEPFGIPCVQDLTPVVFNPHHLIEAAKTDELKEGWIVQFADGDMVKVKTKWYMDLHHSVTFTRERDIASMIVNETVDDFKSYLTSIGESLDKVTAIENRVTGTILSIKSAVENYTKTNFTEDRKTFVERAKGHPYFGLIMQEYSGKEPRYNEFFIKFHLSEYNLETV
jgi:RNA ligase